MNFILISLEPCIFSTISQSSANGFLLRNVCLTWFNPLSSLFDTIKQKPDSKQQLLLLEAKPSAYFYGDALNTACFFVLNRAFQLL